MRRVRASARLDKRRSGCKAPQPLSDDIFRVSDDAIDQCLASRYVAYQPLHLAGPDQAGVDIAAFQRNASARARDQRLDILEFGLRLKRSEEHTSELQSLMRISYAVFCLQKKKT